METKMPTLLPRKQWSQALRALAQQARTGQPSVTLGNRPRSGIGTSTIPLNHNKQLRPKPMRAEEVAAVVKLTGFTPYVEVTYTHTGKRRLS